MDWAEASLPWPHGAFRHVHERHAYLKAGLGPTLSTYYVHRPTHTLGRLFSDEATGCTCEPNRGSKGKGVGTRRRGKSLPLLASSSPTQALHNPATSLQSQAVSSLPLNLAAFVAKQQKAPATRRLQRLRSRGPPSHRRPWLGLHLP